MTLRTDATMDELPDLQSDADVDALMARLRARAMPPASPAVSTPADAQAEPATTGDPIRDLAAAQDAFATAVMRALHVVAETLEDLESGSAVHDSVSDTIPPKRAKRRRTRRRAVTPRRTAARTAR